MPLTSELARTVIHLACHVDGAITEDMAFNNTWSLFSGPADVKAWNSATQTYSTPLYYYKPGTSFDITENPIEVKGLLSVHSGECVAWAKLLQAAALINGAQTDYVYARPDPTTNYTCFLVKNWSAVTSARFYFQSSAFDMAVYPTTGRYGYYGSYGVYGTTNFKNEPTVVGQNTTPDAPSEKVFTNHQFLRYPKSTGTFYDPSYGLTYSSDVDFQNTATLSFGYDRLTSPTLNYMMEVPTSLAIKFSL